MSFIENRSARSLINSAALHAHKTVFYEIEGFRTVLSAQFIQNFDYLFTIHLLAVDGGRECLFKMNLHIGWCIRRLLR